MRYDVVIIGGGVSGLLAASLIAQNTGSSIAIIEKGKEYAQRRWDHLCGVGGAGTLMGGKLCMPPASGKIWRVTDFNIDTWNSFINVLPLPLSCKTQTQGRCLGVVSHIGDSFSQKHYKTIVMLKEVMHDFVSTLIDGAVLNGVKIFTDIEVQNIKKEKSGFIINTTGGSFCADKVIYAGGRSGNKYLTQMLLNLDIKSSEQAADLGIRINLPYHKTISFNEKGKDIKIKNIEQDYLIRSFCVCSGGLASKISLDGQVYWDGHFGSKLTNNVNIGIMARKENVLGYSSAMEYVRELQSFANTELGLKEFLNSNFVDRHIRGAFSTGVLTAIKSTILNGNNCGVFDFDISAGSVLLPAIDNYTTVVQVDENLETSCKDFYVVGDANGLSRGYIQSLWGGYTAAKAIISASSVNLNLPKKLRHVI